MIDDLDEYLQDGSPFLREVDLSILDSIISDLFLEQHYDISQALAKVLILREATSVLGAISKNPGKYVPTTPEQLRRDMAEYYIGFIRPFRLLQLALLARQTGLEKAKEIHSWRSAEKADWHFEHENLPFAFTLLRADPSGVRFINQLMLKEVAASTNLYYKVGIEAARRIFCSYTDILATLIPDSKGEDEEDSAPLLPRLEEHKKNAPPLPAVKPVTPPVQLAEEVFVKLAAEKELSLKTIWTTLPALFRFLVRQPRSIHALFTTFSRFVGAFSKNPHLAVQRLDEVDHIMSRIHDMDHSEQQPGNTFLRLSAEMNDFVGNIMPYPPYPGKSFLQDIQRIRALNERLADGEDVSVQLFEEWERLAEQRGLEQYSALWTMIRIAFGDFSLQQFRQTGQERFIKVARWAYAKPLEKSSVWKADLGTRYLCATRLGKLYREHEKSLKMPTVQLARALHDVYLEMLRVNERLYQRSPYQDSKRKLQARNDFMMARALEACLYLSLHSEEAEAVQWRREAFVIAESGKSRMLREEMALAERLPPTEMPAHLCEIEKRCLARLRAIYAEIAARRPGRSLEPSSFEEYHAERNKLRMDLEQAWAEMEDHGDEAKAYVVARRDEALQWEGLQWDSFQRVAERLGEKFALVSISMLPEAVLFMVLRARCDAPEMCLVPLLQKHLERYLKNYDTDIVYWHEEYKQNRYTWEDRTNEWQKLGDILFPPLEPLLQDVEYVYFLPHKQLHNLPLHALTFKKKPFIERWGVAYAPSISVLESALARPKRDGVRMVMGYAPPRKEVTELILKEANKVAAYFHVPPTLSENAAIGVLQEQGQVAQLIHLSCHGYFDPVDPLNSGIALANGRFTAYDWLQLRLQADLVTLSACQTGISERRPGDDLVGLMRAVLFAGASSLLTTLWSVSAEETLDWMLTFYRNVWDTNGEQIANKIDAFRKATLKLRDDQGDPYYWAPFVLVGSFR
jgi:CHAT domain-containing protein